MKIFIEGGAIFRERSGVGQYTKRLTEAIASLKSPYEFTIFKFNFWLRPIPLIELDTKKKINYRFIRLIPGRLYTLFFKLNIPIPIDLLLRSSPDVIWYPNFVRWPILRRSTKSIVTIYDLSYITYGQYSSPANKSYMLKFVPESIDKATHIVTISESSKQQIIDHYKVSTYKISVVYPGVNLRVFRPQSREKINKIKSEYSISSKYILYVGTLEPRKNIIGLLDAYVGLNKRLTKIYPLVLAGGKGWLDKEIEEKIQSYIRKGYKIYRLGYVKDDDLPSLYSGAEVFVYPTFYEGFGMPPLEAMACGVPVITSDNSSLPEVVGDAAIKVAATDVVNLSLEIERVLKDKKLSDGMRELGLEQAKKFTWEKSARDFLKVVDRIAK